MKPRIWPILLASGLGLALLLSLGVWQVQRLAWKEDLIAKLETRLSLPPIPIAEALAKLDAGEDVEYLKVSVSTYPQVEKVLRKQASYGGQPAWEHITGVRLLSYHQGVLLDLGVGKRDTSMLFIPSPFEAIMRKHDGGRGLFDVENDSVGNNWFWWDLTAMQKALQIQGGKPIVLQLTKATGMENYHLQEPKVELNNNHLGYAITWFGLAAVLVVITGLFVLRISRTR
jgi:surfeit locus 1 family protein